MEYGFTSLSYMFANPKAAYVFAMIQYIYDNKPEDQLTEEESKVRDEIEGFGIELENVTSDKRINEIADYIMHLDTFRKDKWKENRGRVAEAIAKSFDVNNPDYDLTVQEESRPAQTAAQPENKKKIANEDTVAKQRKRMDKQLGILRTSTDPFEQINAIVNIRMNQQAYDRIYGGDVLTEGEKTEIAAKEKALKEQGYSWDDLKIGMKYDEDMKVTASFLHDESLAPGEQRIRGIRKPQIFKDGVMVQSAEIEVAQNIVDEQTEVSADDAAAAEEDISTNGPAAQGHQIKRKNDRFDSLDDHQKRIDFDRERMTPQRINNFFNTYLRLRTRTVSRAKNVVEQTKRRPIKKWIDSDDLLHEILPIDTSGLNEDNITKEILLERLHETIQRCESVVYFTRDTLKNTLINVVSGKIDISEYDEKTQNVIKSLLPHQLKELPSSSRAKSLKQKNAFERNKWYKNIDNIVDSYMRHLYASQAVLYKANTAIAYITTYGRSVQAIKNKIRQEREYRDNYEIPESIVFMKKLSSEANADFTAHHDSDIKDIENVHNIGQALDYLWNRFPEYRKLIDMLKSIPMYHNISIIIKNAKDVTDSDDFDLYAASGTTHQRIAENGRYHTTDIYLDKRLADARTLLHEIIHAYTAIGIAGDSNLQNDIMKIVEHIKSQIVLPGQRYFFAGMDIALFGGAMSNPREFIAEFFSNPYFQELLKHLEPMSKEYIKKNSLFDDVIEAIKNFFKRVFDIKAEHSNLFDQIEPAMKAVIDYQLMLHEKGETSLLTDEQFDALENKKEKDSGRNLLASEARFTAPIDVEKEMAWLDQALPQLSRERKVAIINGLIEVGKKGSVAYGRFAYGMLLISNEAVEGTIYHEAFHYVFETLMSAKDKADVLDEAARIYGTDEVEALEEMLAEDFRNYMLTGQFRWRSALNAAKPTVMQRIREFFRKLYDMVTNREAVTSVTFRNIRSGEYADHVEYTGGDNMLAKNYTGTFKQEHIDAAIRYLESGQNRGVKFSLVGPTRHILYDPDRGFIFTDGTQVNGPAVGTDAQGNPVNAKGQLVYDKIVSIDSLTDEDFENPTRSVELPQLPENVSKAIGANGKPVIIKKNIFEKNRDTHPELTEDDNREILKAALYSPNIIGQSQPIRKPNYWVVIQTADKNSVVVLEVNRNKENTEIVGWRKIDKKSLDKLKKQADREGGQFLIQTSYDAAAALSALPANLSSSAKVQRKSRAVKQFMEFIGETGNNFEYLDSEIQDALKAKGTTAKGFNEAEKEIKKRMLYCAGV